MRSEDQIEAVVDAAAGWNVDGYYIVGETPGGFADADPSTVGGREPESFQHYLDTLRQQAEEARKGTFDDTVAACKQGLDQAATLTRTLANEGIRGQDRDFANVIDVNRAALDLHVAARGARLRRKWD